MREKQNLDPPNLYLSRQPWQDEEEERINEAKRKQAKARLKDIQEKLGLARRFIFQFGTPTEKLFISREIKRLEAKVKRRKKW